MKSCRDLEIYKLSYRLAMKIHRLSLTLPKFELYEEGSQIRRSSKAVCSCIVEGYGRRIYKNDFIRFLVYAQASCDETTLHLNFIHEAGHISDEDYEEILSENDLLGKKINSFIQYVESHWNKNDR
ncbi:MAG: four helix bundle protein [Deltaproteobacteria bacterium]|nr:four helix bundle protein [Deltaproteobacteria bacterium]